MLPEGLIPKYHNPCINDHGLSVPFRTIIVGASGSGKTQLVLEILSRVQDTFGHVTTCCMSAEEPLYQYLSTKIKPEQLDIVEGYENVPDLDKLEREVQHLVVFGDLVLERHQEKIEAYFIRGRKIAKGVSVTYLSQSYYAVPKTTRLQSSYVLLKKLSPVKDLKFVLKDFSLGLSSDELLAVYKCCTEDKRPFLVVDVNATEEERFRKNFKEVLQT